MSSVVGMAARTRCVHFVGIGGIGMSGIAEVLLNLGYQVQGSDLKDSETTQRLARLGGKIFVGHQEANIEGADVVVISSAVKADNPEVLAAKALRIPVIRRAEMLAELMRLKFGIAVGGAHGKTSTTSLIASVLVQAGMDPTIVVGGKLNNIGTTAKLGQSQYLVAEADESDGSFLHLTPTIAVCTNIDREHLDHYQGGLEEIEDIFVSFLNRVPFYGAAVVCVDDPWVQKILPRVERRLLTYGFSPQADFRAENVRVENGFTVFDYSEGTNPKIAVRLAMFGRHNVQNALAAICVGRELGAKTEDLIRGLEDFDGVERRFTIRHRGKRTVVDDYGHHPTEIQKTLEAARSTFPRSRIVAAFQPHRYTRTRDLYEEFGTCFHGADVLRIAPVYAAGEESIAGCDSESLAAHVRTHGHQDAAAFASLDELEQCLRQETREADLVLFLGAGSVTHTAKSFAEWCARQPGEKA